MLDTAEHDKIKSEKATIYHILRRKKRQTDRAIIQIQDGNGCIQKSPEKIIQILVTHLRRQYDTITVEEEAIASMVGSGP
jgi:hypothetical protein